MKKTKTIVKPPTKLFTIHNPHNLREIRELSVHVKHLKRGDYAVALIDNTGEFIVAANYETMEAAYAAAHFAGVCVKELLGDNAVYAPPSPLFSDKISTDDSVGDEIELWF